jgi:CHAT domain-containing protein
LHLIELYLDRASEAWRALQMQAAAFPGQYFVGECVQCGVGALPRPLDSGYRGADYDFIAAVSDRSENGEAIISYTIDTKRARTEVRAQAAQARLLRDLVAAASNDRNTDEQLGRTLFQLLVPIEIEPFLSGSTEMQIELDRGTAGIPWELLDAATGRGEDLPWAIRTKLVRKFRTASYRARVSDASPEAGVLIIGEPECDETRYRRLPGARLEARAIVSRLTGTDALPGSQVDALIAEDDAPGADARTVITRLLERPWRIVHISGHGEPAELLGPAAVKPGDPEQKIGQARGVVLSNGTFLSAYEIRNMRTVPELVFVNCCYLAARNTGELLTRDTAEPGTYDRSRFAAGVAEELIRIGVRCVIAAGWAVEDGPAMAFATAFYDALLRGHRFIDAVSEARMAAYALGGVTWGAYQCYGDPDWVFRRGGADAQAPARPIADEFAGVSSPSGLRLALETLAVQSRFANAPSNEQQLKLRHLEARFAALWGSSGEIAEAFGKAWLEAADTGMALSWLERAVAANDGTASIKAIEQLANVRVRSAWDSVSTALSADEERRDSGKSTRRRNGRKTGKSADAANGAGAAIDAARKQIESALRLLAQLVAVEATEERESLRASAYKRLALIEAAAGEADVERDAIQSMYEHYRKAEELARDARSPQFFYPAMNRMAAELAMHAGECAWRGFDPVELARVREALEQRVRDDPDFWSIVGLTELRVYAAMAHHDIAGQLPAIEAEYADLNGRVSTPWLWRSVYDQAHFVLGRYAVSGSAVERQAAKTLLGYLRRLARAGQAPVQSRSGTAGDVARSAGLS